VVATGSEGEQVPVLLDIAARGWIKVALLPGGVLGSDPALRYPFCD
jgi:hypothetical protein